MADLKTSEEDPVSDVALGDLIRIALAGGGNAKATFSQVLDLFLQYVPSSGGGTELKGLTFTSDTGSTADSDPGNGLFKWNNATQGSATFLYFDNLTLDGVSMATLFASLSSTGYIYLQQSDDSTKWQKWKWTAVTAGSGYYKFAVTLEASAGSIVDNKTVYCDFDSAATSAITDPTDVRFYGTLANDGTTDDSAVFIAAAASGQKFIHARGLNCAILSKVNIPAGQSWDWSGSTWTMTSTTTPMWEADTVDDWAIGGIGWKITGPGSTIGTANGIHVVGCNRWKVENGLIQSIKGRGFYLEPGTASGSLRGDAGQVSNLTLLSCYEGWEDTPAGGTTSGSEYAAVSNLNAVGCTLFGVKTCAGNINWANVNCIDGGGKGFSMVGGANHAHGSVVNLNANHNTGNDLDLSGVVNGQSFTNVHVFGTQGVLLDGCKGVTIIGGSFDANFVVNSGTGSGDCLLSDCYFNGGTAVATVTGTDVASLIRRGLFGAGSPGNTDVRMVSKSAAATYTMTDEGFLHPSADTTARTFTIPANSSVPYPIGKVLSGVNQNGAGVITLAITTDTMRWLPAGTTGSRSIAANGSWTAIKVASTEWALTGVGIT